MSPLNSVPSLQAEPPISAATVTNRTLWSLRLSPALGGDEGSPVPAGGAGTASDTGPKATPSSLLGCCHMRALPRYHHSLQEEGGKCSKGLQNSPRCWRFPAGLPLAGPAIPSPSHALPTAQHRPCWGLLCPPSIPVIPPAPKIHTGLAGCHNFLPFPSKLLFHPLPAVPVAFPETPKAQPRVEALGCVFLCCGM